VSVPQWGTVWRGEGIEGEGANLQWVVGVLGWDGVKGLAVAGVVALWMVVSNVSWDVAGCFEVTFGVQVYGSWYVAFSSMAGKTVSITVA
jgi:hypothetical protein